MTNKPVIEYVTQFDNADKEQFLVLSDVFSFYLDRVDEVKNKSITIENIPHFHEQTKALIHGAVMFGVKRRKSKDTHIVTEPDNTYIDAYFEKKQAEKTTVNTRNITTTVTVEDIDLINEIAKLKRGDESILPKLGMCLDYIYNEYKHTNIENVPTSTDHISALENAPVFNYELTSTVFYTIILGWKIEGTNPELWVVTHEGKYNGVYGAKPNAAHAAIGENRSFERITVTESKDKNLRQSKLSEAYN